MNREIRERWRTTYFDHDRELHASQHANLDTILDSNVVRAGGAPRPLPHRPASIVNRFHIPACNARYMSVPPLAIDLDQLMDLVGTRGMLVWHDGEVVYERYLRGHDRNTRWMTNSASKLVLAMLVARAVEEGAISSYDDTLVTYWPELAGTAWDGVTVDHCLSMTTGIDWHEEDLDPQADTDYSRLSMELAFGSIESFLVTIGRREEPGVSVSYSSADTEALTGALIRATGRGIADYLSEKLWIPGGMEASASWIADTTGREQGLAGLCATLPDYLRIGLLLLDRGRAGEAQLVPEAAVSALSAPSPGLFGLPGHDDYPLLLWKQAFVPCHVDEQRGDYMAAGSYGQIIYVHPETRTVVAHQGVFADITTEYIDLYRLFMAFRQIAESSA